MDATPVDVGFEDAGVEDTGGRIDAGVADTGSDAGFGDPNTVALGIEQIVGTRTYVHVRGTVTSTLPPLVMLPTGPHQGGIPSVFGGHLGGGIGHEYLPEHMDFLLPGRVMIYFDFKATGRTGFGSIGSSTISAETHTLQVSEVLEWAEDRLSIDTSRVDVFGHGYGAGIGMLFAAANPERVNRLVLANPMGLDVIQYTQAIGELQSRLSTSDRMRIDAQIQDPECFGGGSSMCLIELWQILAPRLGCPGNESRVNTLRFMEADRAFEYIRRHLTEDQFDWRPLLPTIEADTTVISGPCDATAPEVALTYTASISGAVHEIIPDTGHWPMVEDSVSFRRAVSGALRYP
jgi:pimeloyl-ACP methyl ester carboxylesterase